MKTTESVTPRNWIGYICESLISSGAMPSWEAAEYLTENLFAESPNPRLHATKAPYEAISQFLHRIYSPIVEAAMRSVTLPPSAMLHVFTDVSVISNSAVLVVYFPGDNQPHQLLLLDAARAWELVFPDAAAFNGWAQERYHWIETGLIAAAARTSQTQTEAFVSQS
jgi:hypothetical protein